MTTDNSTSMASLGLVVRRGEATSEGPRPGLVGWRGEATTAGPCPGLVGWRGEATSEGPTAGPCPGLVGWRGEATSEGPTEGPGASMACDVVRTANMGRNAAVSHVIVAGRREVSLAVYARPIHHGKETHFLAFHKAPPVQSLIHSYTSAY